MSLRYTLRVYDRRFRLPLGIGDWCITMKKKNDTDKNSIDLFIEIILHICFYILVNLCLLQKDKNKDFN